MIAAVAARWLVTVVFAAAGLVGPSGPLFCARIPG